MRIEAIEISNFRSFQQFNLPVHGSSLSFVSENAAGKSSLLAAIAKALGRDRSITQYDFADPSKPLEIALTLIGFTAAHTSVFPTQFAFTTPPTLRVGFRAVWNPIEQEADTVVGFPDHSWNAASRAQREALPVLWLPAFRDPVRLLQMIGSRSILGQLLSSLNIDAALTTAADDISDALLALSQTPDLAQLLNHVRDALASIIPGVASDAFTLESQYAGGREILKEFEVLLAHSSPPLPVSRQSTGLGQLAVFAFALRLLGQDAAAVVLIDEPEVSLHPQAQRALVNAFRSLPNQALIATHSSNILDRADPRTIVRLHRTSAGVVPARAASMTDEEAAWLTKFVNPQTGEACFARKVVLVEGPSDRVALLRLSERLKRNLDAEGVTVLSLQGAGGIAAHLKLLGPAGLGLEVLGLCDEDREANWTKELQKAGIPATDRASMAANGFFVAVKDLEDEFIQVLGISAVMAAISAHGEAATFAQFAQQPKYKPMAPAERLRVFLHNDAVRWAIALTDALNLSHIPGSLSAIISKL